jgi:hypothetical protein
MREEDGGRWSAACARGWRSAGASGGTGSRRAAEGVRGGDDNDGP